MPFLVSDFNSKCRIPKLNMMKTKVENVERWLHFQSVKKVKKTIAEIIPYIMIIRNRYLDPIW